MRIRPSTIARFRCGAAACLALALWAGCAAKEVVLYDPQAAPPIPAPTVYDDRALAEVLRDNVKGGLVDYASLARNSAPLEAYLQQVAFVGPARTPNFFKEPQSRLAYYLNAYNACVLKAVLSENIPPTMYDVRRRRLEHAYTFRIDGAVMTLNDLRQGVRLAAEGDARVEFAMCAAAKGCPPLSNQPFRLYNLSAHLERLAQEAMDDVNMVRVDHEARELLVSCAIWDAAETFKAQYCRETASQSATMLNCLMHMASGIRRQYLTRATGYAVRVLPFDRALNAWQPE